MVAEHQPEGGGEPCQPFRQRRISRRLAAGGLCFAKAGGEPQVAEADAVLGEDAAPVRPPMGELVEPALDRPAVGRGAELDDSAETAHQRGRFPASA